MPPLRIIFQHFSQLYNLRVLIQCSSVSNPFSCHMVPVFSLQINAIVIELEREGILRGILSQGIVFDGIDFLHVCGPRLRNRD